MKIFEYKNDKGASAINVGALTAVYADEEFGKHLIKYTFGGAGVHAMNFVDKSMRDEVLAKIIELMKEA